LGSRWATGSASKAIRAIVAGSPAAFITREVEGEAQSGQPRVAAAERRHLTVMICDLVGSTVSSTRLDPEDMGAVINAYHAACGISDNGERLFPGGNRRTHRQILPGAK
jgi:class 3 adenylate cyclase